MRSIPTAAVLATTLLALPVRAADLFADVTGASGIDWVHVIGAKGEKLLPETMCGGAGWIDYDGDGRLDLYLVNGHGNSRLADANGVETNRLYRNEGGGHFRDVTAAAGVGDRGYGFGCAVGDIDNDGDSDLYVTNFGRNVLYRNEGNGTFSDITEAAGVACPLWSASAAFLDVNGDGFLDLYVTNYLIYDIRREKACFGNAQKTASYCHPNLYDGAPDSLYINRGDGSFADVSKAAGVAIASRATAKGLGVLPTDFDRDGDMDILVANDSVANFLWRNLGNGRFEDAALETGLALDSEGKPEACMGIDGADVNSDGWQDYYVTNFSQETDTLYSSDGAGYWEDGTIRAGLSSATYTPLGFGMRFLDFDLDGDQDIYTARGHILDDVEIRNPGQTFAQKDQLFENDGKGRFAECSASGGPYFATRHVGRAAATADFDDDGDLDFLIVQLGERPTLLESRARDDLGRHWIGFALRGAGRVSRDAYGARVEVTTQRGTVVHEVRSSASYLSANDSRVLIGLGGSTASIPRVRVVWPDGSVEVFGNLAVDRYHELHHGAGTRE
jgi:hypothetical protein